MTQAEFERAVARTTGDTLATVRRLGFQMELPLDAPDDDPFGDGPADDPAGNPPEDDPWADDSSAVWGDDGPQVFDWDAHRAAPLAEVAAV